MSGLIGYGMLDETSGTTADTGAAPANDETIVPGPSCVQGQVGNARMLNGTSQHMRAADEASLHITGAITMAARIKPEQAGTQDLIAKESGSGNGYQLSLATPGGSTGRAFVRFNVNATYRLDGLPAGRHKVHTNTNTAACPDPWFGGPSIATADHAPRHSTAADALADWRWAFCCAGRVPASAPRGALDGARGSLRATHPTVQCDEQVR